MTNLTGNLCLIVALHGTALTITAPLLGQSAADLGRASHASRNAHEQVDRLKSSLDNLLAQTRTTWCPETRPNRFGIELVTQDSSVTK
ncbi:MAG: hypothetical protein ACI89X_005034 [Planctomycetota bacterium]|jgi:hypothetical protein